MRHAPTETAAWYLELYDSHIGQAVFFRPRPGVAAGYDSVTTGANLPFATRPHPYKSFLFDIPPRPGQTATYYLRMHSDTRTSFRAMLHSSAGLIPELSVQYWLLGVLSGTLLFLTEDGLGFQYLWSAWPGFNHFIGAMAPVLLLTFSVYASGFKLARELARKSDVVIFAAGLDSTQEGEGYNSGNDRTNNSATLPGQQQALIIALAKANPNVAVVQSGGVCALHESLPRMKGLVYSFYAGQEAGTALADVLLGDYNPAGRKPVTMPTDDSQLPAWNDDLRDPNAVGYRMYGQNGMKPEFAFGAGLSYSTFQYSNLQLPKAPVAAGAPVTVSVDVTNTGAVAGDEVVQLYLSDKSAKVAMLQKQLKGFERINLAPKQKKTVPFTLSAEDFYIWNEQAKAYEVHPGAYAIKVGPASDKLPLGGALTLQAAPAKPDLKVTQVFTVPRYPRPGQAVTFYAMVKNMGTAPVATGSQLGVTFSIDKAAVASLQGLQQPLLPGQARLLPATTNNWKPTASGTLAVGAVVDGRNAISEWLESNNSFSRPLKVY